MTETRPERAVRETENLFITLADGCRLAARLWLPEGAESDPVPALLEYLPYRKRDGTAIRDALTHPHLAAHGYACLRVDMRGSGESDGLLLDEYLKQEQDDACEILDWLCAQPWCSGAVGIFGISWGGFNALQIAATGHPAVRAIVPICFTDDRYEDDIHYRGGCLLTENPGWAGQMMSYMTRPPDAALRNDWRTVWTQRLADQPNLLKPWMDHQRRDDYFEHGSVCEDIAAVKAPALAIGGWADGYTNATRRLIERLGPHVPVHGINGPWMHKYPHFARPGPRIDILGEMVRWFDRFLKGAANGVEDDPVYRAYLLDSHRPDVSVEHRAGRWIAEPEGPGSRTESYLLRLGPGVLSATMQPAARQSLASPQTVGLHGGAFCELSSFDNHPGDQTLDDGGSLVFETEPLGEDWAVVGRPSLTVTLASDRPQANLCARLSDVHPDGAATRISVGVLNLTHRNGHAAPEALPVGEDVRVRVDMDDCAYTVPKGHRLRLSLSNAYWPLIWPSPEKTVLDVRLDDAELSLPLYEARPGDPEVTFGAPRHADPLAMRRLAEPDLRVILTTDALTGVVTLEKHDDHGVQTFPDHGLEVGTVIRVRYAIHPDDPLSARYETHWTQTVGRGPWRTRTETRIRMHADAETFFFDTSVEAFEDDQRVSEKTWSETAARDGV
jgi:putative CocE/NonD family hydrolase